MIFSRVWPWVSRNSPSEPEWSWAWQLPGQEDGQGPGHPQYKELTENLFIQNMNLFILKSNMVQVDFLSQF